MSPEKGFDPNGDNDISDRFTGKLTGITHTDNSGSDSDSVELVLIDDGKIPLPKTGAELGIYLGLDESPHFRGLFTVDDIELSGPPDQLIIRAKAANMLDKLKAPRTRTWSNTGNHPAPPISLNSIVKSIASEHQLTAIVSADLKAVSYPVINQTEESDMNLLTRLAKDHGAVAKLAANRLIVVHKGQAKSASGKPLSKVTINPEQVLDYNVTIADRHAYASITAKYRDTENATTEKVTFGEGEPTHHLRRTYADSDAALAAAKAELKISQQGNKSLSLTLKGDQPKLMAESEVILSDLFRDGVRGSYTATTVTRSFGDGVPFFVAVEGNLQNV